MVSLQSAVKVIDISLTNSFIFLIKGSNFYVR